MQNPLKRKSRYEDELQRLLEKASNLEPTTDEYHTVMTRINELDKIHNRSSELTKTVIPALGTVTGVVGIYALQQFAGVIVPKALDALASRSQKNPKESI
jgi:flagellar motor component MotA